MRRLAEYLPPEASLRYHRIDDIAGQEITITGVEFRDGNFGQYAVIRAHDGQGKPVVVATGAKVVLAALLAVKEQGGFPVAARFVRDGRRWVVE